MLTANIGKPFEVSLGVSSSTGYEWQVEPLPPHVALLGSDYVQPPSAAIGDPGTRTFQFRADQVGQLTLRFVLKRRWESTGIRVEAIVVDVR